MVLILASHIAPASGTGTPNSLAFLLLQVCLPNIEPRFVLMPNCALASRAQ
jgi:hypothetical protein